MDVLEAIRSRRSIREYREDPVPEDLVSKVLEAGRWAPSASNSQPWNFIVLKDEEVKRKVADVTTYGDFLADAPLGICVVIDPKASTHPVEDGATTTYSMLLAAHALGLGTCWIGSYGSSYEEKVKEILNIPREKRVLSIISLGFPNEAPSSDRKELKKIVLENKYKKM